MEKYVKPNYQKIYNDLIARKHPDKKEKCSAILAKKDLSAMDIIRLNQMIFTKELMYDHMNRNQKHRSYDQQTILQILKYQKENRMNNSELARHFCLSRNSVAKWRRLFLKEEKSEHRTFSSCTL